MGSNVSKFTGSSNVMDTRPVLRSMVYSSSNGGVESVIGMALVAVSGLLLLTKIGCAGLPAESSTRRGVKRIQHEPCGRQTSRLVLSVFRSYVVSSTVTVRENASSVNTLPGIRLYEGTLSSSTKSF